MKHAARTLAIALSVVLAGPALCGFALAAPGGRIDTMNRGEYRCELPGDATGPAGVPVPEEGFSITTGSSYAAAEGSGAYLLTGDTLTMTSGPKRGQRFKRYSSNFLRKLHSNGSESPLRCVRRTDITR